MSTVYSLALFIFFVAALSALRSRVVYELSGTSLLLFGTTRYGIGLYSLIFLPGTIIHELSHWIVAEILQVKTGEISIFPDAESGGEQRLGSVATERSDPFRGFLIGLAPFLSGLAILTVLGRLLGDGWGQLLWWQLGLMIYGIMVVSNSMMISEADRRTWPFILIFFALIAILIYRFYPTLVTAHEQFLSSLFNPLNSVLGVTTGINLVMIGGLYAFRRLIERISGKRITHK